MTDYYRGKPQIDALIDVNERTQERLKKLEEAAGLGELVSDKEARIKALTDEYHRNLARLGGGNPPLWPGKNANAAAIELLWERVEKLEALAGIDGPALPTYKPLVSMEAADAFARRPGTATVEDMRAYGALMLRMLQIAVADGKMVLGATALGELADQERKLGGLAP